MSNLKESNVSNAKLPRFEKSLLMVYEGAVSGSPGGRDDGYPETKYVVIDSREELLERYVKGCQLYECTEVDAEATFAEAKTSLRLKEERKSANAKVTQKAKRLAAWRKLNEEFSTANGD